MIALKNLACGYKKIPVIRQISIAIDEGETLCVLGGNGSGKTTLFKTIMGFLAPLEGEVTIDGRRSSDLSDKERAALIGFTPQSHPIAFAFSALEITLMGRTARLKPFASPSKKDAAIALDAMDLLGIAKFKDRLYSELSGGERQMVMIARALASEAKTLLMDEPTASLDFGNQIKVLACVKSLVKNGYSVIFSSHHPEHVFALNCKAALILKDGNVVFGATDEVVTADNLRKTYDVEAIIASVQGEKVCVPKLN
ncbi:MAG: ABC transporter ATP-binding protein [Helicobacteraceae bacterium]|jgi:iron complex transport system ATP-binding protein|nr:ABC transporter ATP-binding protein [Helicobacteraceae bacterium]